MATCFSLSFFRSFRKTSPSRSVSGGALREATFDMIRVWLFYDDGGFLICVHLRSSAADLSLEFFAWLQDQGHWPQMNTDEHR